MQSITDIVPGGVRVGYNSPATTVVLTPPPPSRLINQTLELKSFMGKIFQRRIRNGQNIDSLSSHMTVHIEPTVYSTQSTMSCRLLTVQL